VLGCPAATHGRKLRLIGLGRRKVTMVSCCSRGELLSRVSGSFDTEIEIKREKGRGAGDAEEFISGEREWPSLESSNSIRSVAR
jgi:hypothetical protein